MLNIKVINRNINSIKARGINLDKSIQECALSIIPHIVENREASLACKLLNALPSGSRKKALVEYFVKFGACKANTKKDKALIPLLFCVDSVADTESASSTLWHSLGAKSKASKGDEWDFDAKLASLVKCAKKALKDGTLRIEEVGKFSALLELVGGKPETVIQSTQELASEAVALVAVA